MKERFFNQPVQETLNLVNTIQPMKISKNITSYFCDMKSL